MDALDTALGRLHETSPVWNRGRFANHGPMVVETLAHWGHDADINSWFEPLLPFWGSTPPRVAPIGVEWTAALGVRERYADWRDFFTLEVRDTPWPEVADRWVARLAPGYVGHLFHGVIRTAHAVRSLTARETSARRQELADALAYWASVYEELPGDLPATANSAALLRDATETYMKHGAGFSILFVHGVTGASAIDRLAPALAEERVAQLTRHAAQACAWVAGQGTGDAVAEPATITAPDELMRSAIRAGGEHAIKLADACLDAYAATHDDLYLVAASDGLERFEGE